MRLAPFVLSWLALSACAEQRPDWGLSPVRVAPSRPWLGIIVTEIETPDAESTRDAPGLSIARVAPASPAAAAGLREGDVLLAIDGTIMGSPEALVALMKEHAPGDALVASILRDGKVRELGVSLGAQPRGWDDVKRVVAGTAPDEALPDRVVDDVLLQFEGRRQRAFVGIETMDLAPGLARYFAVADGQGVLVAGVEPDSPAAAAGLKAGDVLLEVAGEAVASASGLTDALRRLQPGEDIDVAWLRAGARRTARLRVTSRDVPVWTAEIDGASRSRALAELAQHHRREGKRLQDLLQGFEKSDPALAPYMRPAEAGGGDEAALRREIEALRKRLAEVEAELARARGGK